MDGDKKKLPKDLDWNDVNFYKHQQEVEAMEDRDEWVTVTNTQLPEMSHRFRDES